MRHPMLLVCLAVGLVFAAAWLAGCGRETADKGDGAPAKTPDKAPAAKSPEAEGAGGNPAKMPDREPAKVPDSEPAKTPDKEPAAMSDAEPAKKSDAEINDDAPPVVVIETNRGAITLELAEDEAPNTVANFISLAEAGYYDDLTFHRVIPNFMIQGGDPEGTGRGGPGYRIADEFSPKLRHTRGVISMANAGPNTGGSQFFITHVPCPHLDGKHAVFGRVTDGMDVVDRIQKGDRMLKVRVVRKRSHPYEPKKLGH
jgi:peptidyl-prolyl cis-trans isomerase B (cyclophilin B)